MKGVELVGVLPSASSVMFITHGEQEMKEKEAAKLVSDDVEEDPLPRVDIRTARFEPTHKADFFTNLLVKISTRTTHLC